MGCPSPTTEYKFEFLSASGVGGSEGTISAECPAYDQALADQAFVKAKDAFVRYLERKHTDPCGPDCRIHTTNGWIAVPNLPNQVKVKRIFFSIECPDGDGGTKTCLYSFEMIFSYRVLQRTVTCIPHLGGPNDFFLEPISLESDCR